MGGKTSHSSGRVLLVDDDAALRQALAEQLTLHEEFEVDEAGSAAEALARAKERRYDLALLNDDPPDMDGFALCRALGRLGGKLPIIMLAAADGDKLLGSEIAADDYIAKPFRLAVLLARMRARLRRREQSADAVLTIGGYSFRPSAKLLHDAQTDKKISLTEKETEILECLYRAGDKAVSRDVLLDAVWGYHAGIATHTLETHVYRLRQKIELNPSDAKLIITDIGGYRLVP